MAENHSTQIIDQFDLFSAHALAAKAILDCAAVLSASNGRAGGYATRDSSMPDMLKHARDLIEMAYNEADVIRETALNAIKESEARHHG